MPGRTGFSERLNWTLTEMTDFRQDKAIYMQMYERICDGILSGRYSAGDRIPSVRELSEQLEVNTNTVVRAYDQLLRREIVYTRRGMGYFVSDGARGIILADRRREFMEERLPELFRQMRLLGISIDTVDARWQESAGDSL